MAGEKRINGSELVVLRGIHPMRLKLVTGQKRPVSAVDLRTFGGMRRVRTASQTGEITLSTVFQQGPWAWKRP